MAEILASGRFAAPDELTEGGVALFYFAGHGMQIRGRNFLIPVGADIQRENEVEDESVDANTVLSKLDSVKNSLNLVILDACRNNPFQRSFRSSQQGLAQMDAPPSSPRSTSSSSRTSCAELAGNVLEAGIDGGGVVVIGVLGAPGPAQLRAVELADVDRRADAADIDPAEQRPRTAIDEHQLGDAPHDPVADAVAVDDLQSDADFAALWHVPCVAGFVPGP